MPPHSSTRSDPPPSFAFVLPKASMPAKAKAGTAPPKKVMTSGGLGGP